jgi:hypothetical protein
LTVSLVDGGAGPDERSRSLAYVSGTGVEIPAVLVQDRSMLVRLFNAEGEAGERTVSFGVKPSRVELVELDGRVIRRLDMRTTAAGRSEISLSLPRFGIRTLRCELAPAGG